MPLNVVTVTSMVPAASAGAVALIVFMLTTFTLVAGTEPKFTADVPLKPVPVMVMLVPPSVVPDAGEMP